ncbi:MAG: antibiotic biosynthesis monooxygenase [Alphaproteobacteria bacterium]|nr:antibiotic biosynthesis monooxygenase [Alphaproteobacteria bacterium]MDD9842216.1 antibiotic biosynthesis monooxygenase [Alphaproteobacteria bacterium]
MTAFIAKLTIKPDMRAQFEAAQTELRTLTHKHEPNTPVYELLQSRDEPNVYFCVATFTDEAAFEYHMQTDFHDRLVPPIMDCLAGDMELSFYNVIGEK